MMVEPLLDSMRWFSHRRSQQTTWLFITYLFMVSACHPPRFVYISILPVSQPANATFWGVKTHGGNYDPKFELGQDFCTMHLVTKYHHSRFNHSEIIMLRPNKHPQTNRCRWKHPPRFATLRQWVIRVHNFIWTQRPFWWTVTWLAL